MDYHVLEARYVGAYVVWLRFRDGTAGEIDLAQEFAGLFLSRSVIPGTSELS